MRRERQELPRMHATALRVRQRTRRHSEFQWKPADNIQYFFNVINTTTIPALPVTAVISLTRPPAAGARPPVAPGDRREPPQQRPTHELHVGHAGTVDRLSKPQNMRSSWKTL